jgi:hypothetical protein
MNNQPRNLGNAVAGNNTDNDDNDDNKTMNGASLEKEESTDNDVNEVDDKEQETIKSVELTGKDAINLNQNIHLLNLVKNLEKLN